MNKPSYIDRITQMITEHREVTGKKQETIAKEIGVSPAQISKIMTGNSSDARVSTIASIAKYFNVSTDYLLGLTDVASTDKDTIGVCKYIGISEKPIKTLKNFSKKHGALRTEKLLVILFGAFEEILNG